VSVVDWAKARQGRNARVIIRGNFIVVLMTPALLVWLQEIVSQHHDRSGPWIEELGENTSTGTKSKSKSSPESPTGRFDGAGLMGWTLETVKALSDDYLIRITLLKCSGFDQF